MTIQYIFIGLYLLLSIILHDLNVNEYIQLQ